nr:replicase [Beet virus Q]
MDSILGKLQSQELVDAVLHTSATRTQSELHQTMCNHYGNQIKDATEKLKNKKRIDVKRNLTEDQLQLLCDLFPERRIVSSSVHRGTHSMAAAMRKIETDLVLSSFPSEAFIYDVGGNWATHAMRSDKRFVHCCCPILDFRDAQRKMTRMINYTKFIESSKELDPATAERAERIRDDTKRIKDQVDAGLLSHHDLNGKWYCQNRFEDCVFEPFSDDTLKKDALVCGMAIHSIYDIHLVDLVAAMQRKGIRVLTGTFLFAVDMLLGKKEGELPTVNGFYRVNGNKVKYGFYDDPNCGYEHDLDSLLLYITKTFVKSPDGAVYYLELNDLRGDVMFFTLTEATEARAMGVRNDSSFKCLPVVGRGKVVFPIFDLDSKSGELVFKEEILPRDYVSRSLEYVGRMKENQLNVETIFGYLASTNNAVIIGGSARKTVEKVDPRLLPMIATTLLVYTEVQRQRQKLVLHKLRMRVSEELQFMEIVRCVLHGVFGKKSVYQKGLQVFAKWLNFANGGKILNILDVPAFVEVNDRIKLWAEHVKSNGLIFTFSDIEEKARLYEECERERQLISQKLVVDKHGLFCDSDEAGKNRYAGEPGCIEKQTGKSTFEDWMAGTGHFSSEQKEIYRGTTNGDVKDKVPQWSMKYVESWLECEDHFHSSSCEVKDAFVIPLVKELFNMIRSELLLEHIHFIDDRRDTSEGAQGAESLKKDSITEAAQGCSDIENDDDQETGDHMSDEADEVSNEGIPRNSSEELMDQGYECDNEATPAVIDVVPIIVATSRELKGKGLLECEDIDYESDTVMETGECSRPLEYITDDSDDSDNGGGVCEIIPGRWAEMADDSDVAVTMKEASPPVDPMIVCYSRLPTRPDETESDDFRTLAKKEFLWYLRCKMIADKSTMLDAIRDFLYGKFHDGKCKTPKDACFLDYSENHCGEWLFNKSPKRLGHAYAVKLVDRTWKKCKLVPLCWEKDENGNFVTNKPKFSHDERGLYMMCELTFLMNEMVILEKLEKVFLKRKQKRVPRVTLIDGVPGCGKSTHIVKEANLVDHYVLTMGKEASLDLKERFMRERGATESDVKRVRTVDSFIMNDRSSRANVLHFDEALMAHAGTVYFCADMLSARTVICQGDSQQIPFVPRVEGITLKYAKLKIDNVVEKRLTYRSPLDVAAFLTRKGYYGNSVIMSANETLRSMKTIGPRTGMTSIYSIPKVANCQYLTFTQAEKEEMEKYLGKGKWGVNTVHECQGKTYENVVLVRLKSTANEIYPGGENSKPYVVVGTTRHRRSVIYYTMAEDSLFHDISLMMSVQEGKLMKHLFSESVQ